MKHLGIHWRNSSNLYKSVWLNFICYSLCSRKKFDFNNGFMSYLAHLALVYYTVGTFYETRMRNLKWFILIFCLNTPRFIYVYSRSTFQFVCIYYVFLKKIRQIKSSAYRFYEDVKYTTYHERPQTEIHTLCHWLFPC